MFMIIVQFLIYGDFVNKYFDKLSEQQKLEVNTMVLMDADLRSQQLSRNYNEQVEKLKEMYAQDDKLLSLAKTVHVEREAQLMLKHESQP